MLSPHRRVVREVVREMHFSELAPSASAQALSRALSVARQALSPLGNQSLGYCAQTGPTSGSPQEAPVDVDVGPMRRHCGPR